MSSSSTTSDELSLDCRGVFVNYPVHEYRTRTLKEAVINRLRTGRRAMFFQALKGVDVSVKRGECIALIGHNGSGKSTMLKVMAGIIPPSQGTVKRIGTCVPQIELGAGFDPELTGKENIYLCLGILGLAKKEIAELVPSITNFSELKDHIEMPVKTYSSGMYMRLGFACSVCVEADIMLIDEILSVGDENFQKKCIAKMRQIRSNGSTMVLVSHDLNQVQQMADRVLVFDMGAKVFEGHPRDALSFYHELMDKKRLESLPDDVRTEELRQRELQKYHIPTQYGAVVKLRSGAVEGSESEKIFTGTDCKLTIDFDVIQPLENNPCVGFAIYSHSGVRLLGGNTQIHPNLRMHNFSEPGHYTIRMEIPKLPLAAGDYRLVTAAHNSELSRTLDLNGCAQEFTVLNRNEGKNFDGDLLTFESFVGAAEIKSSGLV